MKSVSIAGPHPTGPHHSTVRVTTPLIAVASVALLAALTACTPAASTGAAPTGTADGSADATATAPPASGDSGASVDVCALVPVTELAAAIGVDPGAGVAAEANGLSNCTWNPNGTHTAIAQYSDDADSFLPDDFWPKPAGASDVAGATRGWASADSTSVLVVKGDRGLLLIDIDLGDTPGAQAAWTALGDAIATRLG